jgi:hypothetical protein
MHHLSKHIALPFLAIVLLVVVSLACSPTGALPGGGAQGQPTAQATSSGGQGPFDKLDDLDTYRMKMTWWSKDQNPAKDKGMVTITEWVKSIQARHIVMGETMEVITIGDKAWTKIAGKWVEQQKPPAQNTGVGISDDMLRQMQEKFYFKEVGRDTVIGIPCKRYSYSGQITLPIEQPNLKGEATLKGQGEVCIADKAGMLRLPLRDKMDAEMTIKPTGQSQLPPGGMNVAMHMESEVTDINTPITIQPPEGATTLPVGPTPGAKTPQPTKPGAAASPTASAAQPTPPAQALPGALTIRGTDVIYLAGRSDVKIPPLGEEDDKFPLLRCSGDLMETIPISMSVKPGGTLTFKATGGIDPWGGSDPVGPDGAPDDSYIDALDGLSGYTGPQGALVGVFLDNSNPKDKPAPEDFDFTTAGLGTSFARLTPALGQVFFIGDGLTGTGSGTLQTFVVPARATRLFMGIADASSFYGQPGCYGDNNGAFQVQVSGPGLAP